MLSERLKINAAIYPRAVSSSGTTSIYFDLSKSESATFVWDADQTALTATSVGLVYQATDELGTGAAAITATSTTLYNSSNLTELSFAPTVDCSAADTVTINGLTFTGVLYTAAATADRYFATDGSAAGTSIISNAITNLAALINNEQYGVPGVRALAASASLTLFRDEDSSANLPGDYDGIAISSSTTAICVVTALHMQGIIEIQASKLTLSSNFTHVALNVINTSANYTSAVIIRGDNRYRKPAPPCPITQV
jgi:hypothetical protein